MWVKEGEIPFNNIALPLCPCVGVEGKVNWRWEIRKIKWKMKVTNTE